MAKKSLLYRILSGGQPEDSHTEALPKSEPLVIDPVKPSNYSARIAVYDSFTASPFIVDMGSDDFLRIVEEISAKVYNLGLERGGKIPYIVIREVVENLVHAGFKDVVITVEPDGNVIRISDHGPGITDKQRAFTPGFTTATAELKRYIKGVGSGLPIVKESLELRGGCVNLEDNLSSGLVITLRGRPEEKPSKASDSVVSDKAGPVLEKDEKPAEKTNHMSDKEIEEKLSSRHKKVLMLIAETGSVGPSLVAEELKLSTATAYRDLEVLEKLGLIKSADGKREITGRGSSLVDFITK